jgi:YD repeat-containing protein
VVGDGAVGTPVDTVAYTYDGTWKDKLASFDGNAITYDTNGNPLTYSGWTYTWTQGRKLQQAANGSTTASYKYDASGIRKEKTVNGTTTKYNVVGGRVTWQKTGTNNPIYFLYDAAGKLWGLKYSDGNTYFYVRNAQGDVIKIVNGSGAVVEEYAYDAWGNP